MNWATAAKDFPGGERGLKSVAHFCADLQWEDSDSTPAAQGTWMELALDYEASTGETISARRSARRWQDKSKPELRGGLSAAQKAAEFHAQLTQAEQAIGKPLFPGVALRRVPSLRGQGVRWAAGLSHRPQPLGGDRTRRALEALFAEADPLQRPTGRGRVIQKAGEGNGQEKSPAKASAWASRVRFSFPGGRTSLQELGVRDAEGLLARRLRPRRVSSTFEEGDDEQHTEGKAPEAPRGRRRRCWRPPSRHWSR